MPIVEIITRIALTATASAPFLSPRPTQRAAAIAAASVTRTSSRARLRSGDWGEGTRLSGSMSRTLTGEQSEGPHPEEEGDGGDDQGDAVERRRGHLPTRVGQRPTPQQVGQGAGPGQPGADVESEQGGEDRRRAERRDHGHQ